MSRVMCHLGLQNVHYIGAIGTDDQLMTRCCFNAQDIVLFFSVAQFQLLPQVFAGRNGEVRCVFEPLCGCARMRHAGNRRSLERLLRIQDSRAHQRVKRPVETSFRFVTGRLWD